MLKINFLIKCVGLFLIIIVSMMIGNSSNDLEDFAVATTKPINISKITNPTNKLLNKTVEAKSSFSFDTNRKGLKTTGNKKWVFEKEHPIIAYKMKDFRKQYTAVVSPATTATETVITTYNTTVTAILKSYYNYMLNKRSEMRINTTNKSAATEFLGEYDKLMNELKTYK